MAATPPPAARLRWDQVMAWRAARHHLDERVPAKVMLEVAGRVAGLHAQVLSSAELTLAARVRRAAEAEAERLAAWSGGQLELGWADAASPGGAATG
jgi:hypothetical protein